MNWRLLLLLLFIPLVVRSQQAEHTRDSLANRMRSLSDTTQQKLSTADSTLAAHYQQLQTIGKQFATNADSLNAAYSERLQQLTQKLSMPSDSLSQHAVSVMQHKQDSLQSEMQRLHQRFTRQLDSLKHSTRQKIDSLQLPPELKSQVSEYTSRFSSINPGEKVLPELTVDGLNLTSLPDFQLDAGRLSIPGFDLPTQDLSSLSQAVAGYRADAQALAKGNLDDVQQLPGAIEKTIANRDELKGLAEQTKQLESMSSLPTEEEAKQQLTQQATEAAIDHFAGQDQALSEAMQKLSKYKQKYPSISGLEDLKKRPPNPLKGMPLIERLVPGISFQYQRKDDIIKWDTYIYCGYQIVPRISAGLGWNQRIHYNKAMKLFASGKVYGVRGYTDVRLYRGFIGHVEVERQNTTVRQPGGTESAPQWVWSILTGLKTEYKITRWLRGTVLFQYNLFDRYHKAPYNDRINTRFGFEFQLRKKRR